jgi:hypothetical protein
MTNQNNFGVSLAFQESDPVPYIESDLLEVYRGITVAKPSSDAECSETPVCQVRG